MGSIVSSHRDYQITGQQVDAITGRPGSKGPVEGGKEGQKVSYGG
jgi:hypothetical protein